MLKPNIFPVPDPLQSAAERTNPFETAPTEHGVRPGKDHAPHKATVTLRSAPRPTLKRFLGCGSSFDNKRPSCSRLHFLGFFFLIFLGLSGSWESGFSTIILFSGGRGAMEVIFGFFSIFRKSFSELHMQCDNLLPQVICFFFLSFFATQKRC